MDSENKVHKRRVRYKGTHPKKFNEKYKELQPDKYVDEVQKIISKGKTPAGMHVSICVNEILEFLNIQPGQIGLDATLGYGGHTLKMLECLQGSGHLYCLDADPIELAKTKTRLLGLGYDENKCTIKNLNFADIDTILPKNQKFDFVLADLGLSSMQIDNPERGFTFKKDGPLDLRLNPQKGITGSELLDSLSMQEIERMLQDHSDEPYATEIAYAIASEKNKGIKIVSTKQLAKIVEAALLKINRAESAEVIKKTCQRVFQAIRIDVNKEFHVLSEMLDKLPSVLNSGGRVAILTFHSGEDRLVKKAFKYMRNEGIYSDVARDIIRASAEECTQNPRAHSAKLRWAIKS